MLRFHLPPESWSALPHAVLRGEEAKHAAQVMRVRRGDAITVFDGLGRSALAAVGEVSKHEIHLTLSEIREAAPLRPRICLAQAVPKGKTMDLIVQKAVELGVTAIQPLITRRTVVQVAEDDADRKSGKWQRVALEACKQCGQDLIPEVAAAADYSTWLGRAGEGLKVIASLYPGALPLKEILRAAGSPESVTLLVGPEGDFTPEEAAAAVAAGFQPATLGPIILRAETAAFFAVSALRYEFT